MPGWEEIVFIVLITSDYRAIFERGCSRLDANWS